MLQIKVFITKKGEELVVKVPQDIDNVRKGESIMWHFHSLDKRVETVRVEFDDPVHHKYFMAPRQLANRERRLLSNNGFSLAVEAEEAVVPGRVIPQIVDKFLKDQARREVV